MGDYRDWSRPQTFQQDLVAKNFVGNLPALMDVSAYSSLIISLGSLDGTSPLAVLYQYKATDFSVLEQGLLSANISASGASWTLPVISQYLSLTKLIAGSQIAAVWGTTATAPGKRMLNDLSSPRSFAVTVPTGTAAGTFTRIGAAFTDTANVFADLTGYNGDCMFISRVFTTGGAAQIDFSPEFLNYDGTLARNVYSSHTTVGNQQYLAGHPRGYVRWNVRNTTALTSAMSVQLDVIPNELA